jgi:hypothetical protein
MNNHRSPRRQWVWIVLGIVVVVAPGTVWWITTSQPRGSAQSAAAPDTIGERLPDEGSQHVPEGTAITYQAYPPASGPHYPAPAQTGVYVDGLAPGSWVHSMEHGYVVLVYKPPVSADGMAAFRQMVRNFPLSKFGNVKLVIAPYSDMPHTFAVLSWDWRLFLDTFDRGKILEFYRAHVDHGREDIP